MTWVQRHPRCKMLVYYQDFGSSSAYRIQNYPVSLNVLKDELALAASRHMPRSRRSGRRRPWGASARETRSGYLTLVWSATDALYLNGFSAVMLE